MAVRHILHPSSNFGPRLDFQLEKLSSLTNKESVFRILSIWATGGKQASPWGPNNFVDAISSLGMFFHAVDAVKVTELP
jgi:hypothetical protein